MENSDLEFQFNGETGWGKGGCLNEENRVQELLRMAKKLDVSCREQLRYIIEQNIKYSQQLDLTPPYYRLALLCLFKVMEVEDTVLFYKAKFEVDFDTGFLACPEMVVGKDKQETLEFLKVNHHTKILDYLGGLDYSVLKTYQDLCVVADNAIKNL